MIKSKINHDQNIPKTTLSYYKIEKLIGEGSYGKVYLGKSILLNKKVAIKCYDKIKIKSESNLN